VKQLGGWLALVSPSVTDRASSAKPWQGGQSVRAGRVVRVAAGGEDGAQQDGPVVGNMAGPTAEDDRLMDVAPSPAPSHALIG